MRRFLFLLALMVSLPSLAFADAGLLLQPPVEGSVGRGFDPGEHRYAAGHRGVDLVASPGAEVRASAAGVVHFAGMVAGRPSVSLDHGGVRSTYTPVSPSVSKGDVVAAGDVIGILQAGHCEEGCLHWGLTDGTDYFDPLKFLRQRIVRLLPMGAQPVSRPELPLLATVSGELGPAGVHPVSGRITSRFGMRLHPVTGVYKLHDGSDYGASCGTPIFSPWAGEVIKRDVTRGYGYRVHVRHAGGVTTAYAHMPGFSVEVGQKVAAGQQIGVVGTTGYSTGCHLHWMAWRGGKLVDPLGLL